MSKDRPITPDYQPVRPQRPSETQAHLAASRLSLGGCPIAKTLIVSSAVYSPSISTKQFSVNSPSPGSFPKHKTHIHLASSPARSSSCRNLWTHCVLHIENDRTLSVFQAQPPLRISRQHAEEQEQLSLSSQQVSRRRQLWGDEVQPYQVSQMGSSKGGEAENRYLTHFEVISPVVAADSGRCKVFVSQNDLDQNISIDTNTISYLKL